MPGHVPIMSAPYPHPMFGGSTILGGGFDGSTTYITRGADLTGASDGGNLTLAFRIRLADDTTFYEIMNSNGNILRISKHDSVDWIQFIIKNTSSSDVVNTESAINSIKADGSYHNVLFSVKLAATATSHIYIDDSSSVNSPTLTEGGVMDLTRGDWAVGATIAGGSKFSGDINFFYYDDVYYDFSVESNRRKFFDASGDPVLDPTGDGTPSGGVQPLIYLAGTFNQWENNKGTGGGMTVTGALSEPAD